VTVPDMDSLPGLRSPKVIWVGSAKPIPQPEIGVSADCEYPAAAGSLNPISEPALIVPTAQPDRGV